MVHRVSSSTRGQATLNFGANTELKLMARDIVRVLLEWLPLFSVLPDFSGVF
jgi:hypothetical protein